MNGNNLTFVKELIDDMGLRHIIAAAAGVAVLRFVVSKLASQRPYIPYPTIRAGQTKYSLEDWYKQRHSERWIFTHGYNSGDYCHD